MSYNLRTVIASQTTDNEDDECMNGRMEKDDSDEGRIVVSLKQYGVFQDGGDTLKTIINENVWDSRISA